MSGTPAGRTSGAIWGVAAALVFGLGVLVLLSASQLGRHEGQPAAAKRARPSRTVAAPETTSAPPPSDAPAPVTSTPAPDRPVPEAQRPEPQTPTPDRTKAVPAKGVTSPAPKAEAEADADALTQADPDLGASVKGRPLVAHRYGAESNNVTVVFFAFHGNEPGSVTVGRLLMEYLNNHTEAYAGARVYVVPQMNPDGVRAGTRTNARGVDLNRNFPYGWSPAKRADRYNPGPRPLSEPESQAASRLIKGTGARKVLSIHAPLKMLNYTGETGRRMAELMRDCGLPVADDVGYATPGSFGDYCGKELGIGIVTVELSNQDGRAWWPRLRPGILRVIQARL